MLKRKYGNRSDWNRILKRKYAQTYLNTKYFKGYVTLLNTIKVNEPLYVNYEDKKICIVDDGYMWLQQFPFDKKHAVTTMFDANGSVVQWYIDICRNNGLAGDIPYMDDLFLDIVLLPSGELFLKDVDELGEALLNGIIDRALYDVARNEARNLVKLIRKEKFKLLHLSNDHKEILADKLM